MLDIGSRQLALQVMYKKLRVSRMHSFLIQSCILRKQHEDDDPNDFVLRMLLSVRFYYGFSSIVVGSWV